MTPLIVDSVHSVLADRHGRGGFVGWDNRDQVSAFPTVYGPDGQQHDWPWAVKPVTGTVEVVFQHLATRPSFGDTAVRDELRERINRIPGVELPASRLPLRPSFALDLIVGADGFAAAADAQAWVLNRISSLVSGGHGWLQAIESVPVGGSGPRRPARAVRSCDTPADVARTNVIAPRPPLWTGGDFFAILSVTPGQGRVACGKYGE